MWCSTTNTAAAPRIPSSQVTRGALVAVGSAAIGRLVPAAAADDDAEALRVPDLPGHSRVRALRRAGRGGRGVAEHHGQRRGVLPGPVDGAQDQVARAIAHVPRLPPQGAAGAHAAVALADLAVVAEAD